MVYDALARHVRASKKAHPDVAVILVDEASLKAMNPMVGRWPWPRSVFADLIEFISMGDPGAILFDILFTENERYYKGGLGPNDRRLVEAARAYNVVYNAQQILEDEQDEFNKTLLDRPMPRAFRERFAIKGLHGEKQSPSNNFYIPFRELYLASKGVGVVEFQPDRDGVYRRTRPLRQYKGDFYPVLGLVPLLDILKPKNIKVDGKAVYLDNTTIPLDKDGRYLINMYGKFNAYSISGLLASIQKIRKGDVENLMVSPGEFKGKVVIVGASAVGVEDVKPTTMSSRTPGAMLHASFISNVLMKDFLKPARPLMTVVTVFLFAAASTAGILMLSRNYLRVAVPVALLLLYSAFVINGLNNNRLYETVPQVSAVLLSFMASFAYLSFTEGKEKRKVRKMLGQYVSPQMLSEVVDRYEDFLGAEVGGREHITVLFSDIRDFTSISEAMPPAQVVDVLNYYFSVWSDVIFKHGGTVDKFIGDAIMAFWGAPVKTGDHAQRAVRAAREMIGRLPEINETLGVRGYPPVRIGIGISTGEAILGNIGSEKKLDYTVIGDTVNLASRIEALTKDYSSDILITEHTYNELQGDLGCKFIDTVKVKGKEVSVKIYNVIVI